MVTPKKMIRRLLGSVREYLPLSLQRRYFKCVTIRPKGVARGRVLVSYALTSAGLPEDHPMFAYHTGPWESAAIIRIFNNLGFVVDCIHFTNHSFIPSRRYDVIFACTGELYRLAAYAPDGEKALKIWHPVISSVAHNNSRELERIDSLEKRRPGSLYVPKRQEPYERIQDKVGRLADAIILIGNDHVKDTYPTELHSKITKIVVTASPLSLVKKKENYVPHEREFLWHFGPGAVRKGLDLLLEVFAKHPEWTLNIVGPVEREPDFMKIYRRELTELPNIKRHGYLRPASPEFDDILSRCFCFIAPSATESISIAVVTMLHAGLYPVISRDTGVDLPEGAGKYLETCSIEEIERSIGEAYSMDTLRLMREIEKTQSMARRIYTRERFVREMEQFLARALRARGLLSA